LPSQQIFLGSFSCFAKDRKGTALDQPGHSNRFYSVGRRPKAY